MKGLMQDHPLLISSIFEHAINNYPTQEIVSNSVEGGIHKYTYEDWGNRTKQLANALKDYGVLEGDRIGTLAWNGYRHLELYYATSSSGFICHTMNPRLHNDQIAYIVNHAEDKIIFVDLNIVDLIKLAAPSFKSVKAIVVMTDSKNMIDLELSNGIEVLCYEDFIDKKPIEFDWPNLDEKTASSLCYTSGTTGNPKGVLYTMKNS